MAAGRSVILQTATGHRNIAATCIYCTAAAACSISFISLITAKHTVRKSDCTSSSIYRAAVTAGSTPAYGRSRDSNCTCIRVNRTAFASSCSITVNDRSCAAFSNKDRDNTAFCVDRATILSGCIIGQAASRHIHIATARVDRTTVLSSCIIEQTTSGDIYTASSRIHRTTFAFSRFIAFNSTSGNRNRAGMSVDGTAFLCSTVSYNSCIGNYYRSTISIDRAAVSFFSIIILNSPARQSNRTGADTYRAAISCSCLVISDIRLNIYTLCLRDRDSSCTAVDSTAFFCCVTSDASTLIDSDHCIFGTNRTTVSVFSIVIVYT